MATELPTVKYVYINPKLTHLRHSAHHRAMAPDPNGGGNAVDRPPLVLDFLGGVARDVPLRTFEIFRDMGIATTDRPKSRWEQDEEEGR